MIRKELADLLQVQPPYITKVVKKAINKNQNYIVIKDEKYYFQKKEIGKGYNYSSTPFTEVLEEKESKVSVNEVKEEVVKEEATTLTTTTTLPKEEPTTTYTTTTSKEINLSGVVEYDNLDPLKKDRVDLIHLITTEWIKNQDSRPRLSEVEFIEFIFRKHSEKLNKHNIHKLNRRKLHDWKEKFLEFGIVGLIPRNGRKDNDRSKFKDSKKWVIDEIEKLFWKHHGKITSGNVFRIINSLALENGEIGVREYKLTQSTKRSPIISITTIKEELNRIREENPKLCDLVLNPDKYKNSYLPAFGDMREKAEKVNQYWEIDSTRLDSLVSNEDKETTFDLIAISDIRTGMKVVDIVKNSSAEGISRLLWKAFEILGIPEHIISDNGKDYLADRIKGLYKHFGIKHIKARPYEGKFKAFVERHFGTLQNSFTELLEGFKGHSVSEFQDIASRIPKKERLQGIGANKEIETLGELRENLDEWIEYVYSREYNSNLGTSPYEVYLREESNIARTNIEKLAFIFGKKLSRTVNKSGVQYNKNFYISSHLATITGEEVEIYLDIDNPHICYVYQQDKFITIARDTKTLETKERIEIAKESEKLFNKKFENDLSEVREKGKIDYNPIALIVKASKEANSEDRKINEIGGEGYTQNYGNFQKLLKDSEKIEEQKEVIEFNDSIYKGEFDENSKVPKVKDLEKSDSFIDDRKLLKQTVQQMREERKSKQEKKSHFLAVGT